MIFHSPKLIPNGHVIRRVVSNVDIVPTILDLLGVESGLEFDGVSLAKDSQTWHDGIYFETISTLTIHGWAPLFGIRNDDFKYIHAPTPEIYDVKNDPKELVNLFEQQPEQAADIRVHISDFTVVEMAGISRAEGLGRHIGGVGIEIVNPHEKG